MYYSAIGVLAAIVLLIVNWDILSNSQVYAKRAWNVYKKFLFAVLLYYVTDILWGLLEAQKLAAALFVDTTIYFMAMALGLSFWAEYTVAYLDEKTWFGRFLVNTGRGIVALVLGMTIINVFTPVLFTVDSSSVYTALPIRYFILVCQILFLIIISLHALTSMFRMGIRSEKSVRFRILASFGGMMALCLFAQLWFPYLPLYAIGYMLGTCLLHAFVANDEKEEYRIRLAEAEKIADLKDRFSALLDNMPGMAFTKDAETGVYLTCNRHFAEYAHKTSPEEVTGLTDAQIFDAKTAAHFKEDDKIALSMNKPYIFYEDVLDAMGNSRQLQTTKIKYKDTNGRACILGMCQDITDLVSIQHEHAKTREAYESAVNTGLMYTHIAQTLARDYTQMFYVNTDTEEFTEYRRGEKDSTLSEIRRDWHFFSDCKAELSESVYPEDKGIFLAAMNRKKLMKALSSKDTFILTYRRMTGDKPVYVSMKVSRMENDEQFIIIGFMDVDAEMREAMAKNEALSEALQAAEAANRSKTTFLQEIGNEIRPSINTIIGLGTLALKSPGLDGQTQEYLEKIGDNAQQLLSIINAVLDMSRIEAGRSILNKDEFSLRTLLGQIAAQVTSQCSEKGLHFEHSVSEQAEDFYIGDEKKLKEVLLNILTNAVKFTKAPGRLTLTANAEEAGNRALLSFYIKTTGSSELGIAFSGEDAGSSDLGMTLTNRILEIMHGSVKVTSEKSGGTTFTVTVKLRKGDRKTAAHSNEIDLHALSVLVVDDNPIEAEHARMVLEGAGIHADTCTSGQEALRKMELRHAKDQPYSMVLMDWSMPGMNGMEASAEIHRLYGKESIVVATTAYNWDDIREEARQVGVEHYLEKPLFPASISENLSRIAQQSSIAVFKEKKRARLTGRRILLAEDEVLNAEILTDILDMENIKVDHAVNGKKAVELFKKSTAGIYSAILMDVRMPQMDGLEAAKAIRTMDREDAKRIPIIALTTNAFGEDVKLSVQAGMNGHLTKPVEADRLIQVLGEMIYESEASMTVL